MIRILTISICCLIGTCHLLYCQVEDELFFSESLEELTEEEAERLEELFSTDIRPVHINSATIAVLMEIPAMTTAFAEAIVAFRDTVGQYLSVYELLSVPGIGKQYLKIIAPWLTFAPMPDKRLSQTVSFRIAEKVFLPPVEDKGSRTPLGSPHKVVFRYKADHHGWFAGVKAEKDAGEPFGGPVRPEGFDFYSAYAGIRTSGLVRQLILGDYRVSLGHGLLCNQSFSAGSDASFLYQPHDQRTIRPHTSMDEYLFFRGVAARLHYKPVRLTLFASAKKTDGNITEYDSVNQKVIAVSSIQKSGIHATTAEIEDRRAVGEYSAGASLKFQKKHLLAGINLLSICYDAEIRPSPTFANRYKFSGNKISGASFDLAWNSRRAGFSMEVAVTGHLPAMNGVIVLKANDNTSLWLSTRYYSPGYFSPYANSISRASFPSSETGTNMVIIYSPSYGTRFRVKSDVYRLLATASAPVTGRRGRILLAEATHAGRKHKILLRASHETQSELKIILPSNEKAPEMNPVITSLNIRGEMGVFLTESLYIRTRADYRVKSNLENREGWLMFADADYRFKRPSVRITLRQALYRIEHYDLRIYSREHDALWAYSMAMQYGTGMRSYVMLTYKHKQKLQFWIKAGFTNMLKPGEMHPGNISRDISIQTNVAL